MDAKETSFYTAVLIICIVLGIIIAYFVASIIRQQRRSVQLYRKSILTEITTLEKERTRVSADLHDEMGPMLSSIKLRIGSFELTDEDDRQEQQKSLRYLDELIQRMREISFDMMPNKLLRYGFVAATEEFIEYCNKGNQSLKIDFRYEENFRFTEQQAINLYRIAQEIIHNTIKHAQATLLKIELRREKKHIILASSDNGIGFSYDSQAAGAKGYGLRNLLSRTEIMGGTMFIESKKNKGTTYIFEIPLSYE